MTRSKSDILPTCCFRRCSSCFRSCCWLFIWARLDKLFGCNWLLGWLLVCIVWGNCLCMFAAWEIKELLFMLLNELKESEVRTVLFIECCKFCCCVCCCCPLICIKDVWEFIDDEGSIWGLFRFGWPVFTIWFAPCMLPIGPFTCGLGPKTWCSYQKSQCVYISTVSLKIYRTAREGKGSAILRLHIEVVEGYFIEQLCNK